MTPKPTATEAARPTPARAATQSSARAERNGVDPGADSVLGAYGTAVGRVVAGIDTVGGHPERASGRTELGPGPMAGWSAPGGVELVPGVDTIEPMVQPSPLAWEPLPRPPKRSAALWVAGPFLLLFAVFVASFHVVLPYYAIAPGKLGGVENLVVIPEGSRFPSKGEVLLTTVTLGETRAIDALVGWLDPDVDLLPRDQILPPKVSDDQFRQLNLQQIDDSKGKAVAVALRRLGYTVPEKGEGALIVSIVPGLPADGRLQPGDVITAVDGKPVSLHEQAREMLRNRKPGESVRLDLRNADGHGTRAEDLILARHPDGSGTGAVGVDLLTFKRTYEPPIKVEIRSGAIGGPSAGLAFTLGVIDALTPGDLTGGKNVAVTGTIEPDGTVGPVGGVAQKTVAVKESGVKVFLVPEEKYEEALRKAGKGLKIIKIHTLEDALAALGTLGGDLSALGPAPQGARG